MEQNNTSPVEKTHMMREAVIRRVGVQRAILIIAGGIILLSGCLFYATVRFPADTGVGRVISSLLPDLSSVLVLPGILSDAMPSFLFVSGLSLVCLGIWGTGSKRAFVIPLIWSLFAVATEIGQLSRADGPSAVAGHLAEYAPVRLLDPYFYFGTFDYWDITASVAGFLAILLLITVVRLFPSGRAMQRIQFSSLVNVAMKSAVAVIGFFALVATSPYERDCTYYNETRPVYMSYDTLRTPVAAEAPRDLSEIGKIYVYNNYVFVNSPNNGIHIFDNTDPSVPVNVSFLDIPGNLDIAVRNDVLYADSYIDLVAIDIQDVSTAHEIKRIEDVFPYDPYQNVPEGYYFYSYDEAAGVIVGAREECH